jgi:hypothetical protein
MEFSWTILLILIFILSLLFSFTIEENTLKICYWLVVFLFGLTIFNIILSVQYYIQLRNDPGIKGPRGPPGRKGPIGLPGVCAVDDDCGKNTCRKKITEAVREAFPEIESSCMDNVEECMSDDQRILVQIINKEIDKLETNCKASNDPVSVFVSKIRPQIAELGGNGKASAE